MSAWSYFNGPISYNDAPLGPLSYKVIMHKKTNTCPSWDFRGKYGYNVGVSLGHYRCQLIVAKDTKSGQVLDAVEISHHYLTQPKLTHADRFLHGMTTLLYALKDAPAITCDAQLIAIAEFMDLFKKCADPYQFTTVSPVPKLKLKDRRHRRKNNIPPTPPPTRVPNPTLAAQYLKVQFPGVAAPTPRVETSTPRMEPLQPHHAYFPELVARHKRSHKSPQLLIPTKPIALHMRSNTANIVSLAHTSG